jgi:lysophospholipase L1-like esterase
MIFEHADKIVMIGDSITDCGRIRPVGEGKSDALGSGYVSLAHALLHCVYPELSLRIVNMGISGNTTRNLVERWETDVLELRPDWVSIMIGINDVWRQYDRPTIKEELVFLEEYRRNLDELVKSTLPHVKGIILLSPYYIESNTSDAMRKTMDEYREAVKVISENYGTLYVDIQACFDALLSEMYPAELAWDRVHPTSTGHMAIARGFLDKVGFQWHK